MYLAVHKFNISILATFTGLRTKTNTQAEACMQAHLKAVEQEHPDERLIFCLTDQEKKKASAQQRTNTAASHQWKLKRPVLSLLCGLKWSQLATVLSPKSA